MTKILVVSTYPIKKAQHGGQRRVSAIVDEYKKTFSKVRFVAVYPPDFYKSRSKYDIAVKGKTRKKTTDSPYTGDIACGLAIYEDEYVKKKMTKILTSFKPDIIQIEQVFPYLGLEPLLEELGMKPKLVLSSHNIEFSHKLDILLNAGYPDEAKSASKLIFDCEKHLAVNADISVAVSLEDVAKLKEMGAKKVLYAPNGIAKQHASTSAKKEWADYKSKEGVSDYAIFVGSAHPPNWFGFEKMIGDRMGFLPTDKKIILAGSISDYFKENFKGLIPEYVTFWRRVFSAGRLSDDSLAGLIQEAELILLPITEGGGSNLKTAEAILSGKKIVATSYAFRSFEEYLDLPNIYIADEPEDFRATIIKAFSADYKKRSKDEVKLAEKVQWRYCLKPMVEGVALL